MSINIVPLLEEVLGLLQTINETKGVPEGESISDKNVLQTDNSNPNKKIRSNLSSDEQKRTREVATIFAKVFLETQKKFKVDKALKTSVQRITPNAKKVETGGKGELGMPKKGLMLGGLLMLLGGAGALLMGLLTDGPFKGALKILSKIGISGGIKMLLSGAKSLLKTFSRFVSTPFKFVERLMKEGLSGQIFKSIKNIKFLGIGNFMKNAEEFVSSFSKIATNPLKSVTRLFGKGAIGTMVKRFAPLLKILKKIPFIGSIISIGFAISRFMKGDTVGGVIDVLSALTGLLNLIPGGTFVAIPLSIGLDTLNAFLDAKTAGAEDKKKAKLDILKDMVKGIGGWIWKNAEWLPVIGSFKRWGMAFSAFKDGNIMEGLKQFGLGLFSLLPGGGPIIMGIETLMGFFGSEKEESKELKPNTSWFGKIKEWVKNKLQKLPSFLKTPLQWLGILDDEQSKSEPTAEGGGKETGGLWDKITTWFSGLWDQIFPTLQSIKDWLLQSDFIKSAFKDVEGIVTSVMSVINSIFGTVSSFLNGALDKIKSLNPFGSSEEFVYSEEAKANARKFGWGDDVKGYHQSGWKENPNRNKVEVFNQQSKQHVDDLVLIGKEQIAILSDIRTIGMQTLKVLGNSNGGSVNPIIISNSGGSKNKPSSRISLNTSRGDYGSSPYAFA